MASCSEPSDEDDLFSPFFVVVAAGVDVAMLESEEKARKRRRTVWSWISFKTSSSLRWAIFDVSI